MTTNLFINTKKKEPAISTLTLDITVYIHKIHQNHSLNIDSYLT